MTTPDSAPPAVDEANATQTDLDQPAHARSHRSERFLLWVASLGIARSDGWLGGVAVGIAARLRIDPLIVRGVFVVAALFGLPIIFIYAAAWALLPDADGRVHARDLLQRDFNPVQLGILAMSVIGLFPTTGVLVWLLGSSASYPYGYGGDWSVISVIGFIIGLALVGVLLVLIVRASGRTPGESASARSEIPADSTTPDASVALDDSGIAEGTDATQSTAAANAARTEEATERPLAPTPLAAGDHDPADIEAWRAQHAAWKEQDQAWRRQQQDAERAARDQLRRERQAVAATFAAEAAERRRIRRASNPRARFAFVASAIGLAIVVGAAIGLASGLGPTSGALGLFAAGLVLATAMVIAGIARRRSGFLAFLTTIVLIGGLITGGFSAFQDIRIGWVEISNNESAHISQPFGELFITLNPHQHEPRPITVEKGSGFTMIDVYSGVQLDLHANIETTTVSWMTINLDTGNITDTGVWEPARNSHTIDVQAGAKTPSVQTLQPVTISQESGDIQVRIWETTEGDQQ